MSIPIDMRTVVTGVVTACVMLVITGIYNIDSRLKAEEHTTQTVQEKIDNIQVMNDTIIRIETNVIGMKEDISEIKAKYN